MSSNVTQIQLRVMLVISLLMTIAAITISLLSTIKSLMLTSKVADSSPKYRQFNAIFANLFNCQSCICVSIYFIWLTVEPLEDEEFFLTHTSIRLRVATTVSWYTSKIFLFLIFNGRLYYAFSKTRYRSNYKLYNCLNTFVIIHALLSLIFGYLGALEWRNIIIANIGFNTFHLNLAILLFYLSIQFNRRIFYLSTSTIDAEIELSKTAIETEKDKYNKTQQVIISNKEFLKVVTRSSILLTLIIPFMMSISITWSFHRFVFNVSHFSMCIALLVMELDSFVDIICVLLLFKYCDSYYNALCRCKYTNIQCQTFGFDYCCHKCCTFVAKKYALAELKTNIKKSNTSNVNAKVTEAETDITNNENVFDDKPQLDPTKLSLKQNPVSPKTPLLIVDGSNIETDIVENAYQMTVINVETGNK